MQDNRYTYISLICSTEYYSVNIFQKFTKLVQLLISIQVRIRIEIIRQVIRGITLTKVIRKVLKKILLNCIKNTLEPNNIFFPHELQFGFMENKSAFKHILLFNKKQLDRT